MLFGALTLAVSTTVTSCKDYDDDIKNLQEQIDKVTSTNPVSTEDMKAAISSAIQTLQTQLQTAIDGKADSKAVQDLLKTVEALQTALENKADASTIKTLGDQITELSKQVNSIEGTLNETKKDLEAKVADLTEKLAGAASSEDLKKLANELAEAKNELKAVKDMADNNAAAIVEIQANILELQKLDGRITALETFNQNAASKDDLAAYVAHSELAGLVDNEVLELLKDNGSIAKYVNEVIESQVLAETSAINLAIKGVDDKLATLSTSFETYKSEQATAYQTVTSNITTLTTFKTTIETALTNGGYANFAAVLTEISTIKASYGYCATKADFDNKVEAYLATYKSGVDGEFTALKTRITALENQIQSVVYVPEYEDGKIIFMSYFYDNKLVAETKPIQMKFRISPATAVANFAENYAPSFDGQEIKTRTAEIYNIEKTEVDEATGIVTFTISTSTDKSFAVSLNLIAKDQSKNLTNISSNYFPVISDYRAITDVKVESPNKEIDYILYDKPLSVVDYATGAVLQITGKNRAGDDVTNEPMASSVNAEKFVVSYKVEGDDAASYTIEKGVLKLKNYTDASNGKIAKPKATVTITGTDFEKVTAFADVTAKAASTDPEVSPTISAVKFDGTKEHQTIRPIGPERKQKHARRRDRQAPFPDAGNERIRRILLRRAGRQHGEKALERTGRRQHPRTEPRKRRARGRCAVDADELHGGERRVPEHHVERLHPREQPQMDFRGIQMDLPVNEVRNALGHTVPRGPGERRGLVPHFVPPVRGFTHPRARCAGDAVRTLRDAARARPQHLENHASTSTARPISSESEMSGRTINTRLPMLMRSLGLSPCRLTAQYGSSPARRTSAPLQTYSSGLISMCRSVPLFWRSAALYWGTDAQTPPLCV